MEAHLGDQETHPEILEAIKESSRTTLSIHSGRLTVKRLSVYVD
jgi:hypothetical protein